MIRQPDITSNINLLATFQGMFRWVCISLDYRKIETY